MSLDSVAGIITCHNKLFLASAGTPSAYYTPEQLSGYYDQLITAGYMTREQAETALDQVSCSTENIQLCQKTYFLVVDNLNGI